MGMPLPGHTQTHEQMDKQSRNVIHPAPSIGWVETISEMCWASAAAVPPGSWDDQWAMSCWHATADRSWQGLTPPCHRPSPANQQPPVNQPGNHWYHQTPYPNHSPSGWPELTGEWMSRSWQGLTSPCHRPSPANQQPPVNQPGNHWYHHTPYPNPSPSGWPELTGFDTILSPTITCQSTTTCQPTR